MANLIVVQQAAVRGVEIGFWDYFRWRRLAPRPKACRPLARSGCHRPGLGAIARALIEAFIIVLSAEFARWAFPSEAVSGGMYLAFDPVNGPGADRGRSG
jgi:hypothetical protein